MSAEEVEGEVHHAWQSCYEPAAFRASQQWLVDNDRPLMEQLTHFIVRLFFRGIYFKQTRRGEWVSLLARNVPTMASLATAGWRRRSVASRRGIRDSYSFPQSRHSA
jgi:hypothetical protein